MLPLAQNAHLQAMGQDPHRNTMLRESKRHDAMRTERMAGVLDSLKPGMRREMVTACICIVAESHDPPVNPGSLLITGEPQPFAQRVLNNGWIYRIGRPQQLVP
jgi:hypothetical protein